MTRLDIFDASNYVQWLGSTLVMVYCLIRYSFRPGYLRVLGLYGAMSFIFSFFQNLPSYFFNYVHPNTIGNTYVLFEAVLFSILFYTVTSNQKFRKLIFTGSGMYILFYALVFLFFNTYSFSVIRTGRDLLMIVFAIGYFVYLLRKLPEEDLLHFPMFWINAAVIFYFSGTFLLSYFRDYIVTVLRDDTAGFWAFRNFFRFAFCLVLSYAGWINLRTLKQIQKSS